MTKKSSILAAICLISTVVFNLSGLAVFAEWKINELHHVMDNLVKNENSSFKIITLSSQEFKENLTRSGEIRHQNKMYDIARVETTTDSVKVFCLADETEDALLAEFDHTFSDHSSSQNTSTPLLKHWLKLMEFGFETPIFENLIVVAEPQIIKSFTPTQLFCPSNIFLEGESPPPKV